MKNIEKNLVIENESQFLLLEEVLRIFYIFQCQANNPKDFYEPSRECFCIQKVSKSFFLLGSKPDA